MKQTEWFRDWFDEDYAGLYSHRDSSQAIQQVSMLLSHVKLRGTARVLDAGCGPCRHMQAFADSGIRALGFDLSRTLLSRNSSGRPVVCADLRRPPFFPRSFALIGSFFTSFGYLDSADEDRAMLRGLVELLEPGGWFFLDLLNPSTVPSEFSGSEETEMPDGRKVTTTKCRSGDLVYKEIQIQDHQGSIRRVQERIRLYSSGQVTGDLMPDVGLEPVQVFGDEKGSPWSLESPRLSVLAKRIA